ncbi:MAG: response regulator [Solirubrobacteraceae bacterium]
MSVRVVLADDQPLVRAGLRKIFEADPALEVVAEVEDGLAAVEAVARVRPDVVVMDIRMPNVDGLEATRRIFATADRAPKVLVLTTFGLDDYVFAALRAGASGFLLKDAPPEQLIAAVHTVARGDALLDPTVTRAVVQRFKTLPEPDAAIAERLAELSAREREVLTLLVEGKSNREIAERLVVSEGTVKSHVMAVLRKLGLRDRVQAVIFGYEAGLKHPASP